MVELLCTQFKIRLAAHSYHNLLKSAAINGFVLKRFSLFKFAI